MATAATVPCGYKFLSEPAQKLKCVLCFEVAEEPLQHKACGKLVCKKCMEVHGRRKPCPGCNESKPQFYFDHESELPDCSMDVGALAAILSSYLQLMCGVLL